MKKHQKRLLALIMTLAMTVTVFPMGAFADDTSVDVIESTSQATGASIDYLLTKYLKKKMPSVSIHTEHGIITKKAETL